MSRQQNPLQDTVSVVTGGGRGIGAAIAARLAALGSKVVITGRHPATLDKMAGQLRADGGFAEPVVCDVTSLASVDTLAQRVEKTFGRVDILVNNAGVGAFAAPLHQLPPDDWDRVLQTNLRGVYYCIRAFAPIMIRARTGHIVNVSSIASKNALPNGAAYAASKWGLNGLSYSVAEELRGYGIRVTVICPGSTQTELGPHSGKDPAKMLQPSDIAHCVEMILTQSPQSFASEIVLRPTRKT